MVSDDPENEATCPRIAFEERPRFALCRAGIGNTASLVELPFDVLNAAREQILGDLALGRGRDDFFRGGNRGIGRGGTHIGDGLSFGLSDLGFSHFGAPGDEIFRS